MKTTFFFHGGGLSLETEKEAAFFREFTDELHDGDTVLFIGFARRVEGESQEIYERDKGYILAATDKDITVVNAEYDTLVEQLTSAQAVFITGGHTRELVADIKKYKDFLDLLKGKVIGGTSAGAYLFSTYFYSCGKRNVAEGLGIFPIKMVCHYGGEHFVVTDEEVAKMDEYPDSLELMVIPEQEWVRREYDL